MARNARKLSSENSHVGASERCQGFCKAGVQNTKKPSTTKFWRKTPRHRITVSVLDHQADAQRRELARSSLIHRSYSASGLKRRREEEGHMAEYRCALTIHGRSDPKPASGITFYAYLSRSNAVDERTGVRADFTNRAHELAAYGLALPRHAPEWAGDGLELWKRHEAAAKRRDAQSFRQHQLMIPRGLPLAGAGVMVEHYCSKLTAKGRCASWVIHVDDRGDLHAHVIETLREITPHGFGKVFREEGVFAKGKRVSGADAEDIRLTWETICNDALEAADRSERVSRLSNFARGLAAPVPKLSQRAYHLTARARATRPGYVTQEQLDKAAATERHHEQRRLALVASATNPEIQAVELQLVRLQAALAEAKSQLTPNASPLPLGGEPVVVITPTHQEITHVRPSPDPAASVTAGDTVSTGITGELLTKRISGDLTSAPAGSTIAGTASPDTVGQFLATASPGVPGSPFTSDAPYERSEATTMAPGEGFKGGHATGGNVGSGRRPEDPQDAGLIGHARDGSFGAPRDGTSGASKGHPSHPEARRNDRSAHRSSDAPHPIPEPSSGDDLPGSPPDAAALSLAAKAVGTLSPIALTALQVGIKLRRLSQRLAVCRAAAPATPSLPTPLEPLPTLQADWDALQSPPLSPAALATLRVRIGLRRLGQRLARMRAVGSATPLPPTPLEPLPTLQQAWDALPPLALSSAALMGLRLRAKLRRLGDRLTELRATPLCPAPTIHPPSLPTIPEILAALPPVPLVAVAQRAHARAATDPTWALPSKRLQAQLAARPLWAATATLPSADAADPSRVLAWLSENIPRGPKLTSSTAIKAATPSPPASVPFTVPVAAPPKAPVAASDAVPPAEPPSFPLSEFVEVLANSGDPGRVEMAQRLRAFLKARPEAATITVPAVVAASAESARAALSAVDKAVQSARQALPSGPATSQRELSQPSPPHRRPAPTRPTR